MVGASRKIALFVPSLAGGGAERVVVTLANRLAARGYSVDLVAAKAEGPFLVEVANNVSIVNFSKKRVATSLLPLINYLRNEKPDTVFSVMNYANIVVIVATKLAAIKTRLVISERDSLSAISPNVAGRILLLLMRLFYPLADQVIAVSVVMKSELLSRLRLLPSRVVAIPNPVDFSVLDTQAKETPDHEWFRKRMAPVILAAGRLAPQKGFATLLDAFAQIRQNRDARLIVLGEGAERQDLENRIDLLGLRSSVHLAGFKKNPFAWMGACDLFVLSSKHEGFPNVLVQAMACGARIVSTDCPTGPSEILEGGRWGRLVPVGDAFALASAMGEALDEVSPPPVRDRALHYNVEAVIDVYEEYLTAERVRAQSETLAATKATKATKN